MDEFIGSRHYSWRDADPEELNGMVIQKVIKDGWSLNIYTNCGFIFGLFYDIHGQWFYKMSEGDQLIKQ